LVPGPVGMDSFQENVIHTLTRMGIEVVSDPRNRNRPGSFGKRFGSLLRAGVRKFWPDLPTREEVRLLRMAARTKPDFLLAPTQSIHPEILARLKKVGVRACVAWWTDPPGYLKEMDLLSPEWGMLCLKDPDAVRKFRLIGVNAHLVHEAMNPTWHRPLARQENETVVVAGNYYGFRQVLVAGLMERGVPLRLYGGSLPRWSHPAIKAFGVGPYIAKEEKSRLFGKALACLNSTQIVEGNSLNCRAFEISGAGGLHLMEYRPIIPECFEPGKEVLTFESMEELLGHVERARQFPVDMQRIRDAAAKRALAEHTYRHRLEAIFRMGRDL